MIKNLLFESSKSIFKGLANRSIVACLSGLAVLIPIYQATVFNLAIDSDLIIRIVTSFAIAFIYYIVFLGALNIMEKMTYKLYKEDAVGFVLVLLYLMLIGLLLLITETFLLPNWYTYDSYSSSFLSVLAVLYAMRSYCYKSQSFMSNQVSKPKIAELTSSKIAKTTGVMTSIICLVFVINIYEIISLKNELYKKSVAVLASNQSVLNILGSELAFSSIVKGNIDTNFGSLRYNITGNYGVAVINVRGEIVSGKWRVIELTLHQPKNTLTVISAG